MCSCLSETRTYIGNWSPYTPSTSTATMARLLPNIERVHRTGKCWNAWRMGTYLSSVARQNLKTSSLSSSSQHLDNMSTTSPSPLHPPPPLHPASSPRNTPHPQASTQLPQHPPELFHPLHLNKPAPSKHQHYGPNSQGHASLGVGGWRWPEIPILSNVGSAGELNSLQCVMWPRRP